MSEKISLDSSVIDYENEFVSVVFYISSMSREL